MFRVLFLSNPVIPVVSSSVLYFYPTFLNGKEKSLEQNDMVIKYYITDIYVIIINWVDNINWLP